MIHAPVDIGANSNCHFSVMRAEGGGLGFLFLSDFNAQIWSRKKDCDAAVSWVLRRTVQLDKLLPLKQGMGVVPLILLLLGLAEDNNVLFLMADAGIFMVQLESLQFKRLSKISFWRHLHPFETVYTAGNSTPLHSARTKKNTKKKPGMLLTSFRVKLTISCSVLHQLFLLLLDDLFII